jgi:hypothetical protein
LDRDHQGTGKRGFADVGMYCRAGNHAVTDNFHIDQNGKRLRCVLLCVVVFELMTDESHIHASSSVLGNPGEKRSGVSVRLTDPFCFLLFPFLLLNIPTRARSSVDKVTGKPPECICFCYDRSAAKSRRTNDEPKPAHMTTEPVLLYIGHGTIHVQP